MTETMTVDEYRKEMAKPKAMTASEKTARLFLAQVRARRLPTPRSKYTEGGELRFAAHDVSIPRQGRKRRVLKRIAKPKAPQWQFDFAWPEMMIAVEVEGISVMRDAETGHTRIGGRHASVEGFNKDNEKYAWAAVLGWRLLRFTPKQVANGFAIDMLVRLLAAMQAVELRPLQPYPVSARPSSDWDNQKPGRLDGVQHSVNCACLHTPAFSVVRARCDCGAVPPRVTDELQFGNAHEKDQF